MQDQKNLILAIVLSVAIILLFQMVLSPHKEATPQGKPPATAQTKPGTVPGATPTPPGTTPPGAQPGAPGTAPKAISRIEALKVAPRVAIDAPRVSGSISLKGGLIDDLVLRDYHETVDKKSPGVHLLNPVALGKGAYYALFGWIPGGGRTLDMPGEDTVWTAEGGPLAPGKPVTLSWTSKDGLKFTRRFEIDKDYLVTVTDSVANTGAQPVKLAPYALTRVIGTPETLGFFILHEGPIAVFKRAADEGAVINDPNYKDVKEKTVSQESVGGWLGFTSHYWLVSLIPPQDKKNQVAFRYTKESDTFQADYAGEVRDLAPGGSISTVHRVFAGAKQVDLLRQYGEQLGLEKFDWAIDFGWFWFFTKPFLFALKWIYGIVGNFGIAIMILTIVVKILFFPLANKSYKSMSQMKKLQPEIARLRERYANDKATLNQEMMRLYRKERINPAAGCLPMVLQIPVFFALYKVLYVAIDMRHAPFFGWIHDLSAKDPTSILNLFGLLPYTVPTEPSWIHFISLGLWPLIMGFTMFMQQRLNPTPPDPVQAKVFAWMPVIFTVMLASFPAGLVIYWAWNNTLSIGQQWLIMKRQGALSTGPDKSVPRNIKELEARKAAKAAAAKADPANEKAGS
ncbi:MAG: membrane protein insertase YidC [Rhodospirillaceae bacterium]|nr:membrane protein insertase YidC [Rhodospirillaceae bacterium]